MDLFSVLFCKGLGWASRSFIISDTCAVVFKHPWQSIHTYYAAAKHCSHIMLKVFDGFLPLIHLQPTKIRSLHAVLLWCHGKGTGHVDTATTTLQLTVQCQNCFTMTQRVHACSCASNEQCRQHNNIKKNTLRILYDTPLYITLSYLVNITGFAYRICLKLYKLQLYQSKHAFFCKINIPRLCPQAT
jgi:hypothetical protein